MATTRFSLGRALAHLQRLKQRGELGTEPNFSKSGIRYLKRLQHRMAELETNNRALEILRQRSRANCRKQSRIAADEDLFLSCLVVGEHGGSCPEAQQFIRHLNDCYPCFAAYAEVMGDYAEQMQQFSTLQ